MEKRSIANLKKEIESLPKGYLYTRTIGESTYYYHRYKEGEKRLEIAIEKEEALELERAIKKKKSLKKELEKLKKNEDYHRTRLRCYKGENIKKYYFQAPKKEERDLYASLIEYLNSDSTCPLVLYGIDGSGKKTLIFDAILNLEERDLKKTVVIEADSKTKVNELNELFEYYKKKRIKNVFILNANLIKDIEKTSTPLFHIVFLSSEPLSIQNGIMLNTNYLPYKEANRIYGCSIMDYITDNSTSYSFPILPSIFDIALDIIESVIENEINSISSHAIFNAEEAIKAMDSFSLLKSIKSNIEQREMHDANEKAIEYLTSSFILTSIESIKGEKRMLFTRPALYYNLLVNEMEKLCQDLLFSHLDSLEKKRIKRKAESKAREKVLLDAILLNTIYSKRDKKVIEEGSLMIVVDEGKRECEVYNIKAGSYPLLEDAKEAEDYLNIIKERFGKVIKKSVLYLGKTKEAYNTLFMNIEEYLLS